MQIPDSPIPDELGAPDGAQTLAQIHLILKHLLDHRCLLTVQVGRHSESYTSAVLEVARDVRYLVLDELMPVAGHKRVLADPNLQIRARLDGIDVRFSSRVTQVGEQGGLPYYKVPFPDQIEYPQRRQAYRVAIPFSRGIKVALLLDDDRDFSGELRDISPGGLGIRVRSGTPDPATDKGQLAICRIELGADRVIVTDVELCFVEPFVRGRVPRMGAGFRNLRPEQTRRIEQFCAELAREQRRVS